MGRCRRQVGAAIGHLGFSQLSERGGPMENPIAFDERKVGRHNYRRGGQRLPHEGAGIFVEEPGEHGTRLGVDTHRSPRSSSSN